MTWYEILIIIAVISFVIIIVGTKIYKMLNFDPNEKCACCDRKCNHFNKYYNNYKKKKECSKK